MGVYDDDSHVVLFGNFSKQVRKKGPQSINTQLWATLKLILLYLVRTVTNMYDRHGC